MADQTTTPEATTEFVYTIEGINCPRCDAPFDFGVMAEGGAESGKCPGCGIKLTVADGMIILSQVVVKFKAMAQIAVQASMVLELLRPLVDDFEVVSELITARKQEIIAGTQPPVSCPDCGMVLIADEMRKREGCWVCPGCDRIL